MTQPVRTDLRTEDLGARFTAEERKLVERARAARGQTMSAFIREAVLKEAEGALSSDLLTLFGEFIGALDVPGAVSGRDSEQALWKEKHAPENRRHRRGRA